MPKWIDCTGDACQGDLVRWTEIVWGGGYRNPTQLGERQVVAFIEKDSYGAKKQQHTFTLKVQDSTGYQALFKGCSHPTERSDDLQERS